MSAKSAEQKILLEPNTLWNKTVAVTAAAKETGALQPIETEHQFIEQNGINFLVRNVANVIRKEKAKQQQKKKEQATGKYFDPFLPYEPDLFVSDITPTHLCLLNKFNVVDNHLLLVTRDFEEQTNLLNLDDFIALCACMQQVDGLAFFNGGTAAGASQRHKHLQLVPLPFVPNTARLPINPAIDQVNWVDSLGTIPGFTFSHAIAKLDSKMFQDPVSAASTMLNCYQTLLSKVGLQCEPNAIEQPGCYNFLATRNWMLIIPRQQESYQSISINSLGFAGSLFVKKISDLELLQTVSPIGLLSEVVGISK